MRGARGEALRCLLYLYEATRPAAVGRGLPPWFCFPVVPHGEEVRSAVSGHAFSHRQEEPGRPRAAAIPGLVSVETLADCSSSHMG